MAQKIIRDPVHDVIALATDQPVERLLFDLLGCPEVQRLRRVRQLGMASLAYPGADHSRYSHSIGVMEIARQVLDLLARSRPIDPTDRAACLAGAVLHDVGHGPFSHVFERVSGVKHELLTYRMISDPRSSVYRTLIGFDKLLPERVINLLQGLPARSFLSDILSSQLDADRLDYLLRDNMMTGSQYGSYDLRWLLQSLTVTPSDHRLAVTWKGVSAVEAYLQARYHMYRNVYFHKVVRAGEGMVRLALQRAKRLAAQERLDHTGRDDVVNKMLLGQRLTVEDFIELDDVAVLQAFKNWTRGDDAVLAALCSGLLHRRLFKTIDLTRVTDPRQMERVLSAAAATIEAAGGDSGYAMFYDQPADTPYQSAGDESSAASEVLVVEPDSSVTTIAKLSPMIEGLVGQLTFRRLHIDEQYRDAVMTAISPMLK